MRQADVDQYCDLQQLQKGEMDPKWAAKKNEKRKKFIKKWEEEMKAGAFPLSLILILLFAVVFLTVYMALDARARMEDTGSVHSTWKRKMVKCRNCTLVTPQKDIEFPIPFGTGDNAHFDQGKYIRKAAKFLLVTQGLYGRCPADWATRGPDVGVNNKAKRSVDLRRRVLRTITQSRRKVEIPSVALGSAKDSRLNVMETETENEEDHVHQCNYEFEKPDVTGCDIDFTPFKGPCCDPRTMETLKEMSDRAYEALCQADKLYKAQNATSWYAPTWGQYQRRFRTEGSQFFVHQSIVSKDKSHLYLSGMKYEKNRNITCYYTVYKQYSRERWSILPPRYGLHKTCQKADDDYVWNVPLLMEIRAEDWEKRKNWTEAEAWETDSLFKMGSIPYYGDQRNFLGTVGDREPPHDWDQKELGSDLGRKRTARHDQASVCTPEYMNAFSKVFEYRSNMTRAGRPYVASQGLTDGDRTLCDNADFDLAIGAADMQNHERLVNFTDQDGHASDGSDSKGDCRTYMTPEDLGSGSYDYFNKLKECLYVNANDTRPIWASKPCHDCHVEKWNMYPPPQDEIITSTSSEENTARKRFTGYSPKEALEGVYWHWQLFVLRAEDWKLDQSCANDPGNDNCPIYKADREADSDLNILLSKFPRVQRRLMWQKLEQYAQNEILCQTRSLTSTHSFNKWDSRGQCWRNTVGYALPMATKSNYKNWYRDHQQGWWSQAKNCLADKLNKEWIRNIVKAQHLLVELEDYESLDNCTHRTQFGCQAVWPFQDHKWEEAMYDCSSHLDDRLEDLRIRAAGNNTIFMEAWSWGQLAGLILGKYQGWNSFDAEVMSTLVVPFVIHINASQGVERVLHQMLVYPEHTSHEDGLRWFQQKMTSDWKGKAAVVENGDHYVDQIIRENTSSWEPFQKQFLSDASYVHDTLGPVEQIPERYDHLTRIRFGPKREWIERISMTKIYNRFLRRTEEHQDDTLKYTFPGACKIKAWIDKDNGYSEDGVGLDEDINHLEPKVRYLLPSFLHTLKLLEGVKGKLYWADTIQSPFPYQMTQLYTTERSMYGTVPITDWDGSEGTETLYKKWIPLTPDQQWVQLRWDHPDEFWNHTIVRPPYKRMQQRVCVKGTYPNVYHDFCDDWAAAEMQWQPCKFNENTQDWLCEKNEAEIRKYRKVNATYAFGSYKVLDQNRADTCTRHGFHNRVAHWPKFAAPVGWLQGVDPGTLMFNRYRVVLNFLCRKNAIASRHRMYEYFDEKYGDRLKSHLEVQLLPKNDPFRLEWEEFCTPESAYPSNSMDIIEDTFNCSSIGESREKRIDISKKGSGFPVWRLVGKMFTEATVRGIGQGIKDTANKVLGWIRSIFAWFKWILLALVILIILAVLQKFCGCLSLLRKGLTSPFKLAKATKARDKRIMKEVLSELRENIKKEKSRKGRIRDGSEHKIKLLK